MSLMDRIKDESQKGGWRPHPIGTFPGKIEEITEKDHEGRSLYEVLITTPEGRAKTTVWVNSAAALDQTDNDQVEKYVKGMARMLRVYRDLGLKEPDGKDETELEKAVYGRLGEWIDRDCQIVVKANKNDANNPIVFINAPQGAKKVTANSGTYTPPASAFDNVPAIHPDSIPF